MADQLTEYEQALLNDVVGTGPADYVGRCIEHLLDTIASLRADRIALVAGLEELLSVAERMRGGDPSLDPEEWYAARDFGRVTLARLAGETDTPTAERSAPSVEGVGGASPGAAGGAVPGATT